MSGGNQPARWVRVTHPGCIMFAELHGPVKELWNIPCRFTPRRRDPEAVWAGLLEHGWTARVSHCSSPTLWDIFEVSRDWFGRAMLRRPAPWIEGQVGCTLPGPAGIEQRKLPKLVRNENGNVEVNASAARTNRMIMLELNLSVDVWL